MVSSQQYQNVYNAQYLVLDIETVKNDRAIEYFKNKKYTAKASMDSVPASITNIKTDTLRQSKLDEWKRTQAAKIENDLMQQRKKDEERAGLHWWTGKICCICTEDVVSGEKKAFYGDDEYKLLYKFLSYLQMEKNGYTLIGKNSKDFDIPFTVGRLLANNTGLTRHFGNFSTLKDVNEMFSYSKACSQIGHLSDYAWGLGVSGKLAHGSDVQGMYDVATLTDKNVWNDIVKYCEQDVNITSEMVRRYYKTFKMEDPNG